jgi:anti-anti-sigma factor
VRDVNNSSPTSLGSGAGAAHLGEPGAVQVLVDSDRTCIVLSGEVDADLAADLAEATEEAERQGLPIEVDAHHVTFMDSSGVAFLARLSIRSTHRVRLLRVPPTVRFLLEVTRIGELLDVQDDTPALGLQGDTPAG